MYTVYHIRNVPIASYATHQALAVTKVLQGRDCYYVTVKDYQTQKLSNFPKFNQIVKWQNCQNRSEFNIYNWF